MGEVIYLGRRVATSRHLRAVSALLPETRSETPHARIERLVKEAAAHWTTEAIMQRMHAARQPGLRSHPIPSVGLAGDFMSSLSPDQLRQCAAAKARPKTDAPNLTLPVVK